MERQITVRIPAEVDRALQLASRKLQRKSAEIVREALRQYLGLGGTRSRTAAGRVSALLGSLDSGVPDLAVRHREYVLESLKHAR